MYVLRTAIHGEKVPLSNAAMVDYGSRHDFALLLRQSEFVLDHTFSRIHLSNGIRFTQSPWLLNPSTFVAGQPRSVSRPCQEKCKRFRHRNSAGISTHFRRPLDRLLDIFVYLNKLMGSSLKSKVRGNVGVGVPSLARFEVAHKCCHTCLRC